MVCPAKTERTQDWPDSSSAMVERTELALDDALEFAPKMCGCIESVTELDDCSEELLGFDTSLFFVVVLIRLIRG